MLSVASLVGLWIVAVALTVFILGPSVGFLLGRRRIDVEIHPEPAIARPYPEDTDGLRRYQQFLDLGFKPVGWSSEHARFLTPLHWRWRSLQGARWLAAADGCTFVCLYRLTEDEPVRFSATTLLDGDGSWSTSYPGAGLKLEPRANHGRGEVRGVEPAQFVAKHAALVETFRLERSLRLRSGTFADATQATLAYERAHFTRWRSAEFLVLPVGLFVLPASSGLALLAHGGPRACFLAAGAVISSGLFYLAFRYGVMKLTRGYTARRTHTREFDLEQTAVAPDGTVVPGRYERWVRTIAAIGAADMLARLVFVGVRTASVVRQAPGSLLMGAMLGVACGFTAYRFRKRTAGQVVVKDGKPLSPTQLWYSWGMMAFLFSVLAKSSMDPARLLWFGGAVGLAILGWQLERVGRK